MLLPGTNRFGRVIGWTSDAAIAVFFVFVRIIEGNSSAWYLFSSPLYDAVRIDGLPSTAASAYACPHVAIVAIFVFITKEGAGFFGLSFDIKEFLEAFGGVLGKNLSKEQLTHLFMKIDADAGGTVGKSALSLTRV